MHPERRQFLFTALAIAASRVVRGQGGEFSLNFKSETLDPDGNVAMAIVATTPCIVTCQLYAGEGQRSLGVKKWELVPREARTLTTNEGIAGLADISLRADVLPQGTGRRPHLGGIIRTGGQSDLEHLKQAAAQVPFQADPAPRPNPGHFTVDLHSQSNVLLKIWSGDNESGPIVFSRFIPNVSTGPSPIPWNLRNQNDQVVKPGEYLATLEAKPTDGQKSNTLFFASFQVV